MDALTWEECRSREDVKAVLKLAAEKWRRGSTAKIAKAIAAFFNYTSFSCFPSIATIAERAGVSPRTVRTGLRDLRLAGLLAIKHRGKSRGVRTSSVYTFRKPKVAYAEEGQKSPENEAENQPNLPFGNEIVRRQDLPSGKLDSCLGNLKEDNPSNLDNSGDVPSPSRAQARARGEPGNAFVEILSEEIPERIARQIALNRRRRGMSCTPEDAADLWAVLEQHEDPVARARTMAVCGHIFPEKPPSLFRQGQNAMDKQFREAMRNSPRGIHGSVQPLEDFGFDDDYATDRLADIEGMAARKYARDNGLPPPTPVPRHRPVYEGARHGFDLELTAEAGRAGA